ncbi:hypothetical protein HMPREF0083_02812 [Aneurinibacillus aneurinilyticus ATCC 12856]|uniref:Uncharacterized protein n=1 Tax=Aneurinibacillus aneurinilyticus ATCC 12856 TaxID=649747 RepID=U1WKA9_ANEAE|nr:hypothetical protein HMPREF0083_02812 [Aneurinibacillus aneurinilyticus ATCC 12856]
MQGHRQSCNHSYKTGSTVKDLWPGVSFLILGYGKAEMWNECGQGVNIIVVISYKYRIIQQDSPIKLRELSYCFCANFLAFALY